MLRGLRTQVGFFEDIGAARDWYAELLGFGPYYDTPYYIGFDVGGYELGVHPADGQFQSSTYWAVDDLDAAIARVVALGATVVKPAQEVGGGIALAEVRDPFGNVLGLIHNPTYRAEVGGRVAATTVSPREIVVEADVAAPVAEVWRRWTTAEGLGSWLAEARVDLRIGGVYELYFDADQPAGLRGSEGCRVLSFLPQRMLSFTWNAPPHLATRGDHTWVVVEFTEGDAGTHVRLTHTGWPEAVTDAATDWPATFAYFEAAWVTVMDALVA